MLQICTGSVSIMKAHRILFSATGIAAVSTKSSLLQDDNESKNEKSKHVSRMRISFWDNANDVFSGLL